jgi:hypothetical protein
LKPFDEPDQKKQKESSQKTPEETRTEEVGHEIRGGRPVDLMSSMEEMLRACLSGRNIFAVRGFVKMSATCAAAGT